jgi:sulfite oxidase
MVNFRNFSFPFVKRLKWGVPLSLIGGAAAWSILPNMATQADALATGRKARLFSRSEVTSHSSKEKRIWISFENGVYDITDFVDIHPGGNKILLAAGKAIDPYWAVFIIHKSEETKELLEEYRIGDLLPADEDPSYHEYSKVDPGIAALFENEPVRDDSLIARSERPYNAEAAMESLDPFITRNEKFYVRNHLPVPKIELDNFKVTVEGLGISQVKEYTLEDLKKFPKTEITATIQCAGNRRNEMHNVKPVKGLLWSLGAIGNAKWSGIYFDLNLGVMLSDILKDSGYKPDDKVQHVHFHGLEGILFYFKFRIWCFDSGQKSD